MTKASLINMTAPFACRRKRAAGLAVALWLAATTLVPAQANAGTIQVSGTFTRSAVQPLSCLGIICNVSDFTGDLEGHAENTTTSLIPSTPAGVVFFSKAIIHTANGNLSYLESGAGNAKVPSDGESVYLCEITGGTGVFTGASGYLQLMNTSHGSLGGALPGVLPGPPSTGEGQYQSRITAPLIGD